MEGSVDAWARYDAWNAAVAEVLFTSEQAGTYVYLDVEDDVLDRMQDIAEPDAIDGPEALAMSVRETLVFDRGPAALLRRHLRRLDIWWDGSMVDPPPVLAILGCLSRAAHAMHGGEGMAAHNYYDRLARLMRLEDLQKKELIDAYRRTRGDDVVSNLLWASLNEWLVRLEGNRGLPTAEAVGFAHVGLPMSQALVRRMDRERMGAMFASAGLAPHGSVPLDLMERLLDEWLSQVPCPATKALHRSWRDGEVRERIASVACQVLEAWDGPDDADASASASGLNVDTLRMRALVRTFPSRRLDLTLLVPAGGGQQVEIGHLLDRDGSSIAALDLVPAASGWLTPADDSGLEMASVLAGQVEIQRDGAARPFRRRPRRLVPLTHDPMLSAFVETERVQLGEEAVLLAHSELVGPLDELLSRSARPGYRSTTDIPGLPAGWRLYDGVQILSSIPRDLLSKTRLEFNVLQPLATSQVVLEGGLRLPGNIRKWSSRRPPELRAVTHENGVAASITCVRSLVQPTPPDRGFETDEPVLIWDLAEEGLGDGDYEITVTTDAGAQTRMLRLRSADNPAVRLGLAEDEPIAHDPAAAGFGLLANRSSNPSAIQGIPDEVTPGAWEALGEVVPPWRAARRSTTARPADQPQIVVPGGGSKDCFATGAHLMQVETLRSGLTTLEGVCKTCGLVKRYPVRPRKKGTGKSSKALAPTIDVTRLDAVRPTEGINWDLSFDAVCHLGAGSATHLERIASQMDASSLFGDAFARRLEILGHIELHRNGQSLQFDAFEVVDPTLVGLSDGDAVLMGFRSEGLLVELEDLVAAHGGTLAEDTMRAPTRIRITGLTPAQLHEVAADIKTSDGRLAQYVPNGARALAAVLPPLSSALAGLQSTAMPHPKAIERWDENTARFVTTATASRPGAYRMTGFSRTYFLRRPGDVEAMRATVGDARIVKYAANLTSGQSLIGYDAATRSLYVPLGADLPGLYGRAAVLASGAPPIEVEKDRILIYRNVPADLAARIRTLLST